MFVLLYVVCKFVRLGILAKILCVYVCVPLEGMYTYNIGHFVNEDFFVLVVV